MFSILPYLACLAFVILVYFYHHHGYFDFYYTLYMFIFTTNTTDVHCLYAICSFQYCTPNISFQLYDLCIVLISIFTFVHMVY
jgi:hypothetical protein